MLKDHEPNNAPIYNTRTGMVVWLKIPEIFREFDECVMDGWTDRLMDKLMD